MERTLTARAADPGLHGLLIVDKPGESLAAAPGETSARPPAARGYSSHDIVQQVRRWSGQRRIGHTGTLDPMASGVLVLCLGRATRLVEYYQGHDKQYDAEIALGAATDTYDAAGVVTAAAPVPPLSRDELEQILAQFRGDILQTPPAYSAIKQQGEALYAKARRGEAVQAEPRPVSIRRLEITGYEPGARLGLRVTCSAGTYIRSLAHDIGRALGAYAHLARLRREAAGPFSLSDAQTLEAVQAAAEAGQFASLLLPLGDGLDLPALHPDAETLTRLGYGQIVAMPGADIAEGELAQVYAADGEFAGIVRCLGREPARRPPHDTLTHDALTQDTLWKAEKWLLVA